VLKGPLHGDWVAMGADLSDVTWHELGRSARWLVVIDDADTSAHLNGSWIRSSPAGLVVVISDDTTETDWGPQATVVRLGGLAAEDGGTLILRTVIRHGTDWNTGVALKAQRLTRRLAGTPLALRVAGADVATSQLKMDAYLRELDEQTGGDPATKTAELALAHLTAAGDRYARPLLGVLACFADELIPREIITAALLAQASGARVRQADVVAALDRLVAARLVDEVTAPAPAVALHQGLRAFAARQAVHEYRCRLAVVLCLAHAVRDTVARGTDGLPVARALAAHLPLLLRTSPDEPTRELVDELAGILADAADRLPEITLRRAILAADVHDLGPEHRRVIADRSGLALAIGAVGQRAEAVALMRHNVEEATRLFGSNDRATLVTNDNLARVLTIAGQYQEAIDLQRRNLAAVLRLLGPDDRLALGARSEIAINLRFLGRYHEEIEIQRASLAECSRVLGDDDMNTVVNRGNLATVLLHVHQPGEAIALLRRSLADATRLCGAADPRTAVIEQTLAGAIVLRRSLRLRRGVLFLLAAVVVMVFVLVIT
jgi:tetratricopeptide (TPR) repeat protein